MTDLTPEQKATNYETQKHIQLVGHNINIVIKELLSRAELHDASKLDHPEVQIFTENTKNLAGLTYGSEEWNKNLEKIKPALDHHYAHNSHHPQHYKQGIDDMNIVDIVEMFCDWKASSMRHNDGNIRKSIEINGKKYEMSPQLIRIFENSVELFE